MSRISFKHSMLGDLHVITSPEIKGLYVTGKTERDAEQEALRVVTLIEKHREGQVGPMRLQAVEYAAV